MGVISNPKKLNFTEVRRGPPRSVSFYTRSRKSEKSEKFQEVMVRRPPSFSSESSITTNPLAHAGDNPLLSSPPLIGD